MKENPKPCRKCGDLCRHDDDGDTICRFCEAAHEDPPWYEYDGHPECGDPE